MDPFSFTSWRLQEHGKSTLIIIKKNYFDAFQHEKHFKKQPQSYSQTDKNREGVTFIKIQQF